MTLGTPDTPLRVAIIGSGPSGFYAADALLNNADGLTVEVDMFDRLLTPHGLVRGGVAPDHQKIKSVTKVYDKIAAHPRFRFYGNVTFGETLSHADMTEYYHQIIYAVGAQTDRALGIAGEALAGSHTATEFVAWYNGHPDYRHLSFDLSQETAVVVGNGNVAMDVTRILASTHEELAKTDIADYALAALERSQIKRIIMLGRRGPAQAAFTHPELKEFGELEAANVIVAPADALLDPFSAQDIQGDRDAAKNVTLLQQYAAQAPNPAKPRQIIMRFLVSPVELLGSTRLEAVKVVKNMLERDSSGALRARATDETEVLPAGLIFRSIGYQGVPLPDVPFDLKRGVIPNVDGRVIGNDELVTGEYVVGWIKRGPSGIIGTNKPDSIATVKAMLFDAANGQTILPATPSRTALEACLNERAVRYISYADWQQLDAEEVQRGVAQGRPRIKFTDPTQMLAFLNKP
ncbi:MAG: FAD-dependent oxidoreductase [Phototrophicaceae bacterium]|jgi:ferredoxin--NADP+ reductase